MTYSLDIHAPRGFEVPAGYVHALEQAFAKRWAEWIGILKKTAKMDYNELNGTYHLKVLGAVASVQDDSRTHVEWYKDRLPAIDPGVYDTSFLVVYGWKYLD